MDRGGDPVAALTRPGRVIERPAPLSFAEQDAWLHAQLAGDVPVGTEVYAVRRHGTLDVGALEEALADLIERQPVWRTTWRQRDGGPEAVVGGPATVRLPRTDLRGVPDPEREATQLVAEDARRPFDLTRGPLYRARLVHVGDVDHRLYLTLHNIIGDGVTLRRRLLPELAALYAARVNGTPPPPAPCRPYRELALREHHELARTGARELQYWRRRLTGAPPAPELRPDRPHPALRSFRGARVPLVLPPDLARAARQASRRAGVSLFVTLLAAFAAVLERHTGEEDLVLGTLGEAPALADFPGVLGSFVNPLALRIEAGGEPSFRRLLDRAGEAVSEARRHAGVPFTAVVDAVLAVPERTRHPLFAHALTLQGPAEDGPPGWELVRVDVDPGASRFDVHLDLEERPDTIVGWLTYRTDLFDAASIRRLGQHFCRLLGAAVADVKRPVSTLALDDELERRRLLVEWSRTEQPYPADATVHALVGAWAARAPERVALVTGQDALTYGELDRRAEGLARDLHARGLGRGAVVGVAMERSPEAIVAFLGILKAGAAYLPLNPADPPARLRFMLHDAGAGAVVVGPGSTAAALAPTGLPVLDAAAGDRAPSDGAPRPPVQVGPDDLIYVMYTSGSTGRPKGVMVPHRGIVRLVCSEHGYLRLGPDEVVLQATALTFDVSAFEIWGALLHGARLVLYPAAVPTARELSAVIRRHGVTTMWLTPSVFNAVVDEDPRALAGLRQLDLGGEALSVPHVARAARILTSTRLVNGYGPTECSVSATAYDIPPTFDPAAASVPIGRPIANTTTYVLDRHLAPVPIGVPGELYLGGPGLARGYVNRPQETTARFVASPFGPAGERLYRTGDLARWREDGTLEYLGRLDGQVKIRGLRIELGEIEAVLSRHPAVAEAAAVVRQEPAGGQLCACVVPRAGSVVRPDELRDHVRATLPPYMVPAVIVPIDALPLTASGKLDRRALATHTHIESAAPAVGPPPPVDSLEGQLVALWQELLGRRGITITDDFFDLGGHSLAAARMLQQVGDLTGRTLPLGTLYECPTIERLARRLRQDGDEAVGPPPRVVTLQRGGDRTPLLLFHGMLTGGAFYTLRLARRLGARQPIHVVPPFTGRERAIPATIEAMADRYLDVVREVQPSGPYRLSGYCNGGLVAYEVARRLHAAGETIDVLALVAAVPVMRLARTGRLVQEAARVLRLPPALAAEPVARVRSFLAALSELHGRRARLAYSAAKVVELAGRAWRSLGPASAGDGGLDALDTYHRIIMRYFPRPSGVPLVLLWPQDEGSASAAAAAAVWGRLVPTVTVHVVPGDHLAVLHEHLPALADRLAPYLLQDDETSTASPIDIGQPRGQLPAMLAHAFDLVIEHAIELGPCLA
jgi:amino acid adenylation domain-containing protein